MENIHFTACEVMEVVIRPIPEGKEVEVAVQLANSKPERFVFKGIGDLDDVGSLIDAEFLSVLLDSESQCEFGTVTLCWMTGGDDIQRLFFDEWKRLPPT